MYAISRLRIYFAAFLRYGLAQRRFGHWLLAGTHQKAAREIAYLCGEMPQHHASFIAIAYNPLIKPEVLQELETCLQSLQAADFVTANTAYLEIRDYQATGVLLRYTIAASAVEAMMQLEMQLKAIDV